MSKTQPPLYPMSLYLYNAQGRYTEPIQINDEAHLNGFGIRLLVQAHIRAKLEIRITDPLDQLVFHSQGGEVLWPDINAREQA